MSERRLSPLFTWRSAVAESSLKPTLRHVALTLSLHMNERGGSAFPSLQTLANESGLHRATVCRALAELEALGWLSRTPGGGRGRSTVYRATAPETVADGDRLPETVALRSETVALNARNSRTARPEDVKRTTRERRAKVRDLEAERVMRDELEIARDRCLALHGNERGRAYSRHGICGECLEGLELTSALGGRR